MLKPGKYYVGDLCYVLSNRWSEVCDQIIVGEDCLDGEFTLPDGTMYALASTKYGDGQYSDQYGNDYCVDAGLIGAVAIADLPAEVQAEIVERKLGHVHEFDKEFTVIGGRSDPKWDGEIRIGSVVVETDPPYDEEEEEYDDGADTYEEEEA
jgi:hypothetical protein